MNKVGLSILSSFALLANVGVASAQQIKSPTDSILLEGPATLNAYNCYLELPTKLTGFTSPDLYSSGNVGVGTNTPNPSPQCVAITIPSGSFSLSNYNPTGGAAGLGSADANISNLVVSVAGTPCTITTLTAKVEKTSSGTIIVIVIITTTSCGTISASLEGPGDLVP